MTKIWNFIKRHKVMSAIALIVLLGVGYSVFSPTPPPERSIVTAERTEVAQEVDVTGRVEAADKIDLAIESGGKVRSVPVKVGDKVAANQILVQVDTAELSIRLARQQAALRRAQIAVEELENPGSSLAGIESENRLAQARENKTTAENDLAKAYEDAYNVVSDAFLDLPDAINSMDDILGQSYLSNNTVRSRYGDDGRDYLKDLEASQYEAEDLYDEVLKEYRATNRGSSNEVVEELADQTYEAAKKISDTVKILSNFLNFIERENSGGSQPANLASDQAEVDSLTGDVNSHLSRLLGVRNDLKNAREDLANAEREIKESERAALDFFRGADLERARLDARQASLDVQDTVVQINERTVRSPIVGTVTQVNARVGELLTSGTVAAAVISENTYQVKAFLSESDLSKVTLGAESDIVLDTYGSDVIFKARVVAVDPAETLVDGVSVYGMTLEFDQADERIRSGLTADITVKGERRSGVMAVPQRAVITRNSVKYVQILDGENVVEREVETGLRGSDGNIEITKGLQGGEQVIVFVQN